MECIDISESAGPFAGMALASSVSIRTCSSMISSLTLRDYDMISSFPGQGSESPCAPRTDRRTSVQQMRHGRWNANVILFLNVTSETGATEVIRAQVKWIFVTAAV
jgi:hypothetical protein